MKGNLYGIKVQFQPQLQVLPQLLHLRQQPSVILEISEVFQLWLQYVWQ